MEDCCDLDEEESKSDDKCNGKTAVLGDINPEKIKVGVIAILFLDTKQDTKGVLLSNCHP